MKCKNFSIARGLAAVVFIVALMLAGAAPATAQTLTTLVSFDGTDGVEPRYMVLAQGTDGDLYGSASGGADGYGEVFKITPAGTLTVLHSFDDTDGFDPWGAWF